MGTRVAGYKAFEDAIVEFRHMLRLLSSDRVDCYGSDFKLCSFIFSTGNGKAHCFFKETLQTMWEECQEQCQFNFICSSTSCTITNNITHFANKFRNSCYMGLVQSVWKSEFCLFYGS